MSDDAQKIIAELFEKRLAEARSRVVERARELGWSEDQIARYLEVVEDRIEQENSGYRQAN